MAFWNHVCINSASKGVAWNEDGTLLGPSLVNFDGLRRSILRVTWDQARRSGAFSVWEMLFCKERGRGEWLMLPTRFV